MRRDGDEPAGLYDVLATLILLAVAVSVVVAVAQSCAGSSDRPAPRPQPAPATPAGLDEHAMRALHDLEARLTVGRSRPPRASRDHRRTALPSPTPAVRANSAQIPASGPTDANLTRLAGCESGDNPAAYNPAGPYLGRLQWALSTWHAEGGAGDPRDASRAAEWAVARHLWGNAGWAPWPACAAKLGLTGG